MRTYKISELILFVKKYIYAITIVFLISTTSLYFFLPDWANAIGNIFTISGFPVAFLGLIITYEALKETELAARSAEESAIQAKKAVLEVKNKLNSSFAVINLVAIEEIMVSIKELHRIEKWESVLAKYERLKSILVELRSLPISEEEKRQLVGCSGHISVMERSIESYLHLSSRKGNPQKPDIIKFNEIMSQLIEQVREVLGNHKQGVIKDD